LVNIVIVSLESVTPFLIEFKYCLKSLLCGVSGGMKNTFSLVMVVLLDPFRGWRRGGLRGNQISA